MPKGESYDESGMRSKAKKDAKYLRTTKLGNANHGGRPCEARQGNRPYGFSVEGRRTQCATRLMARAKGKAAKRSSAAKAMLKRRKPAKY